MKRIDKLHYEQRMRAYDKFSPSNMLKSLIKMDDGTVVFDRSVLIDDIDLKDFWCTLVWYYATGWGEIDNITVYFEIRDGVIYAGGYNLKTEKKINCRALVSDNFHTPYTYTQEGIKRLANIIMNA